MGNLVLVRKPKLLIEEAELKEVLGKYQGAYGMAAAFDNTLDVESGVLDFSKGLDAQVASIDQLQKYWNDASLTFFFSAEALSADSRQPFTILETPEGAQQVIAFLSDGNYAKHAEPKSLNTPAFFAMAKFLRPTLLELAREAKGEIEDFLKLLGVDKNADNIMNNLFDKNEQSGSMTIMCIGGENGAGIAATFNADKTPGIVKPWGWMSSPITTSVPTVITTSVPTVPTVAAAKPKPKLSVIFDVDNKTSVKTGAEVNANIVAAGGKVTKLVQARPKSGLPNGIIKKMYGDFNYDRSSSGRGVIPNRWKDRVPVEVDPKWLDHRDFINSMEVVEVVTKNQFHTSTASAHVQVQSPQPTNVGLVVLSPTQKQVFIEDAVMKGYINNASTRSADDLCEDEATVPKFNDLAGFSLADLKKHTPESLAYLTKNHPELAAVALHNALRTVPAAVVTSQQQPKPSSVAAPSSPAARPKLQIMA